jgi:hypothetical protein
MNYLPTLGNDSLKGLLLPPGHAVAQLVEALRLQAGRSRVRFPKV